MAPSSPAASRTADARCGPVASPLRVRKQDGSLAQQIRRAAVAAEAEDLQELRRALRCDVLEARRLLEEQQTADAFRREEHSELRACVARCRDEAASSCATAKEQYLRFETAQDAIAKGYREGDMKLGGELLSKMSELNAKLGENMAALEVEVMDSVCTEITSLREELERRTSRNLAEELETKCSHLMKEAEASLAASLAEAADGTKKALRTCRKEHEAFLLRRQKQLNGLVSECQEQLRDTRGQCDSFAASISAKVEASQEQEQRRWSGLLDSRLGRVEGECQALLSDARQHLGASEEKLQEWRRDAEALRQDQRSSAADLRSQLSQVSDTAAAGAREAQAQRALLQQLAADFESLRDRLVVVEGAVSKQSSSVQSLRHKVHTCKESCSAQHKELKQALDAEVSELRRTQADSEAKQVADMAEKQQALRRHCRAWSLEAAQSSEEVLKARLQEVATQCEKSVSQMQAQCRDWVDTALARLEALAVRTREQLGAFAEEVPFTVRRLLVEELGKDRPKQLPKARRPLLRQAPPGAADLGSPKPEPFALGEPLAPARQPIEPGARPPALVAVENRSADACVVQQAPPPPAKDQGTSSPPKTPLAKETRSAADSERSELHDISFSPHAAG